MANRLRSPPESVWSGAADAEAKGEMARALAVVLAGLVAEIAKISHRIEQEMSPNEDGRLKAWPLSSLQ